MVLHISLIALAGCQTRRFHHRNRDAHTRIAVSSFGSPPRTRLEERADPAASANAREWDVIRMGLLRSTSPLFSGPQRARPRVAHL
jgi:hypothetical protein